MSTKKSYNVYASSGMDDMEFVSRFGLDTKLAYTKGINEAMLDHVYEANLSAERQKLVSEGVESNEALKQATNIAKNLRAEGAKALLG